MGMAEFDWLRRMASPGGELTRTSPNVRRVRSHLPAVYLDSQRAVQKRLKPRFTVTYCIPNRVHNIQSHFGPRKNCLHRAHLKLPDDTYYLGLLCFRKVVIKGQA
jgi:hypothetical protein